MQILSEAVVTGAAARRLAESAAKHALEAERERRLPSALIAEIAAAGLFRMCVPASIGGLEARPAALVENVETLARADGATGWCVAVAATSGLLAGYLERPVACEIYGPEQAIAGGVFAPLGRATPVDGGYRVSGRWPFASGCEHCDWLIGGSLVNEGEGVVLLPSGSPEVRLMLAPAAEVAIHDTWTVAGLRATGSHDIEFSDLHVPAERSLSIFSERPREPGPLYAFPLFGLLAIAIAGVGLGIGRGALDDLSELALRKTPAGGRRTLAERATVQADLARAEAAFGAARALLYEAIATAWEVARSSGEVPVAERARLRLAATHAAAAGASAAGTAYHLGGGGAIYESSSLQRRFRDANVVTQHMLVGPATWELGGRLLLGLPTDTSQL